MSAAPRNESVGFQLHRFDAALGAEIICLDLSQPPPDRMIAEIRKALLDCGGLLAFRSQNITPEQHVAFSRRFGPLMIHVLQQFLLPGYPEILRVSNVVENGRPIGLGDAGSIWHSDLSYTPEPSLGSLLYALDLPAEGGDTSFANMTAAYDALPADIMERLAGKSAVHSYIHGYEQYKDSKWRPALTEEQKAGVPEVIHPLVRIHPETGRRALFVNEAFTLRILDVPDEESRELLGFLFAHCAEPRFVYRHPWQGHDLVFWDNRCTIHKAHGCPPQFRRHMHRTTIKGEVPR